MTIPYNAVLYLFLARFCKTYKKKGHQHFSVGSLS